MSKQRKVMLIFDIMCTIISAVLVIVNIFKGDFGMAILWNMSFVLWICNIALDLVCEAKEKIMAILEEDDDEK